MEMKVTYEIENGKKVKVKTWDDGTVYKFDEKGNWIYYKESDDYEQWREYDANGNEIHFKDSYDFEEWKEYDSKGNMIHRKRNDGYEWFAEDYEVRKKAC